MGSAVRNITYFLSQVYNLFFQKRSPSPTTAQRQRRSRTPTPTRTPTRTGRKQVISYPFIQCTLFSLIHLSPVYFKCNISISIFRQQGSTQHHRSEGSQSTSQNLHKLVSRDTGPAHLITSVTSATTVLTHRRTSRLISTTTIPSGVHAKSVAKVSRPGTALGDVSECTTQRNVCTNVASVMKDSSIQAS
jgi:hypothetical protein